MKKKDLKALRSKSANELRKMANEKRQKANKAFVEIKTGQEKNLKEVKNLRKDIAQILTVLKEKEIVEEEKAEKKKGKGK